MSKHSIPSTFFGGIFIMLLMGAIPRYHDARQESAGRQCGPVANIVSAIRPTDTRGGAVVKHAEAFISGVYPDTIVNGTIKFDADSAGFVTMNLELTIPAKSGKTVAVHIHAHGDCANSAMAAHGHWNPTNELHGKWGSENFHSGDIGNISLDKHGRGTLVLITERWTLGGNDDTNILNRSVIVHGGTDDYSSQPAGNSGSRIGCGIIK